MKVFTRDYRITGDYPEPFASYFRDMKPCVLDVETTGLDRKSCRVILTGLLVRTESGVRTVQFLAENHYEEPKVLEATLEFLKAENIGYLITYNGASFDVPFINTRFDFSMRSSSLYDDIEEHSEYRHRGTDFSVGQGTGNLHETPGEIGSCKALELYNFDLLRFLRTGTDLKQRIGSLRQKSVEEYYGILSDRGDTITGRESVLLYEQYAVSGSSTIEKIILTHNREDIVHLHRLMHLVLGDICKAAPDVAHHVTENRGLSNLKHPLMQNLHSALAAYGIPAAGGRLIARPSIRKTGRRDAAGPGAVLRITGEQLRDPVSCAYFPDADSPLTAIFNASSRSFEIEAPLGLFGDTYYIDAAALLGNGISALEGDTDLVNGYLVLDARSTNRIAALLAESRL